MENVILGRPKIYGIGKRHLPRQSESHDHVKNVKYSCGKEKIQILVDIKYFLITERIEKKEVSIKY